jgi:single-strand DNA-binding protein
MLNHITLMGRLVRPPELRKTPAGISVVSFTVACDRDVKAQDGTRQTDFIDVVAWRQVAEFTHQYLGQGRMAVIDGRLQIREWTDKEDHKRRNAEIVAEHVYFGDSKTAQSAETTQFEEIKNDHTELPF